MKIFSLVMVRYGKEVYFWSFVVAIRIFALGGGISVYEGIQYLQYPHPIANPTVAHVNEVLTMHMKPDFIHDASTDDVESAIAEMDGAIKNQHP